MTPTITAVFAREILDSGGRPTVEVELELSDGSFARASVPAGTSTGRHEARELRDGDPGRFAGEGVLGAVRARPRDDRPRARRSRPVRPGGDRRLPHRARRHRRQVGARGERGAGGLHRRRARRRDLEGDPAPAAPRRRRAPSAADGEHHQRRAPRRHRARVPGLPRRPGRRGDASARRSSGSPRSAPRPGHCWRERGFSTLKAAEGGFAPPLPSPEAALDLLVEAVARSGRSLDDEVAFAVDVAATHFFDGTVYRLEDTPDGIDADALIGRLEQMTLDYPILSIEDGLAEDDWDGGPG